MTAKEFKTVMSFCYLNQFTGEVNTASRTYDGEFVTWDELLQQYINFLSLCYGYDISEYVQIDRPEFRTYEFEQMGS